MVRICYVFGALGSRLNARSVQLRPSSFVVKCGS